MRFFERLLFWATVLMRLVVLVAPFGLMEHGGRASPGVLAAWFGASMLWMAVLGFLFFRKELEAAALSGPTVAAGSYEEPAEEEMSDGEKTERLVNYRLYGHAGPMY